MKIVKLPNGHISIQIGKLHLWRWSHYTSRYHWIPMFMNGPWGFSIFWLGREYSIKYYKTS